MKMILPPLEKGDRGGFFRWIASEIPPGPPFSKGGNLFRLQYFRSSMKFKNDTFIIIWDTLWSDKKTIMNYL